MPPGVPAAAADVYDDLLPKDEDLLYEEELLRNPFALRMWWRYLEARKDASAKRRYLIFERALKALPGSYKLWYAYLSERRDAVKGLIITSPAHDALSNTFERALVSMHKMPRIWIMYLEHLVTLKLVTRTRRTFDKALAALPITQHDRIWPLYLKFVMQSGVPVDTAMRVYRRYLKLMPQHTEEYIAYLRIKGRWGEVALKLADIVNDDTFRSLEGKTKHQLWLELCDVITKHPREVKELKVDAILRSGIRRFTDEVGRLWTSLADYYIRRGLFERARDVYEEGLTTVITVHDFSLIFDALTQFEESLLAARMEQMAEAAEEAAVVDEADDGSTFLLTDDGDDLDLRLARLEHLMERRPLLLSSVMLRQNPHNVREWHRRAKLFKDNPTKQILTYTEAVKTVDPEKATGKPFTLWLAFAKVYESHGDLDNARVVFEKATQASHKYLDDLASVWAEWAEMEIRNENYRRALDLLRRATVTPDRIPSRQEEQGWPPQKRLYRSLKLWCAYCDLEENFGTLESTKAVYEKMLDLKIATPNVILNYAAFMLEHKYFEEAFRVYERGVTLFKYPHVKDIWTKYLQQFIERYQGTKIERTRDLFRTALAATPSEFTKPIFMEFAKFEEAHGLARSAMEVYDKAVQTVPLPDRLQIYELYVAKAKEVYGIGKVREIYESAIERNAPYDLADDACKALALKYASLERKIQEIDRARAIYQFACNLADPRTDKDFWQQWNDFEVKHGNEDTFREMLRMKRSVAASYSQVHFNTPVVGAAALAAAGEDPGNKRKRDGSMDDMAALEQQAVEGGTRVPGFVSAGIINAEQAKQEAEAKAHAAAANNPEDIALDDDDEEMPDAGEGTEEATREGAEGDLELQEKAVPQEVFGAVARQPGALERFRKKGA